MPPWFDLVVLLSIVVSTGWWMALLGRRQARGGRFLTASAVGFVGLALIATMVAHCIDVLSRLAVGTGHDGGPFTYNFRTYSLLLLGVALIASGAHLLRASLLMGASATGARADAVRGLLTVLLLALPLVPIHGFFAIPLSAIAGAAMVAVLWQAPPAPNPG
jgi:hypothetical protein